jgi:hypothetical protein
MYDSMVVAAYTESEAQYTHPEGKSMPFPFDEFDPWTGDPNHVSVARIGLADPDINPGIIFKSFNAG